jgi:hypothetical protein
MTNRALWVSRAALVTALLGLVTTAPAQPADAPAGVAVVVGNARSRRPTSSRAASRVDPGSAQQHGSTNRRRLRWARTRGGVSRIRLACRAVATPSWRPPRPSLDA